MYIVVTGAAGFIGSNIVKALNERGETGILAVDNLTRADKFRNLVDCEIADFLEIPLATVKTRLHHARKHLKAILQEKEPMQRPSTTRSTR